MLGLFDGFDEGFEEGFDDRLELGSKPCLMQQVVDTKLTPKNQIIHQCNCILFRNSLIQFRNSVQLHEK